jgi:hypothetical protein
MNILTMESAMTEGFEEVLGRDERGRFVPGQSGNPLGKAPGTRNRATLLRAALDGEEGPALARIIIDKALAGDVVTARFVIGRLEPKPRDRGIELDLPEGSRARDIVAAFDATFRAMASGEITPDEAVQVTRVLDGRLRAIEVAAWEAREEQRRHTLRPSPSGRGLGEGVGFRLDGAGKASARRPHPGPLPRGEGDTIAGEGAGRMFDGAGRVAAKRPHPGPLPRGEGERIAGGADWSDSLLPPRLRARSRFPDDLLHSTCIFRVPPLSPALVPGAWVV